MTELNNWNSIPDIVKTKIYNSNIRNLSSIQKRLDMNFGDEMRESDKMYSIEIDGKELILSNYNIREILDEIRKHVFNSQSYSLYRNW